MMSVELFYHVSDLGHIQGGGALEQDCLVEMVKVVFMLVEKPLLDRRQEDLSRKFLCLRRVYACHNPSGQIADITGLEKVFHLEGQILLPEPTYNLDGPDGIATEFEEAVRQTHLRRPEDLGDYTCYCSIHRRNGWFVGTRRDNLEKP